VQAALIFASTMVTKDCFPGRHVGFVPSMILISQEAFDAHVTRERNSNRVGSRMAQTDRELNDMDFKNGARIEFQSPSE